MKYTVDQLQSMAVQYLMHESAGDSRCAELKSQMQERTGYPPHAITQKIHELAMRQTAV
jgi:hypothetical protein